MSYWFSNFFGVIFSGKNALLGTDNHETMKTQGFGTLL